MVQVYFCYDDGMAGIEAMNEMTLADGWIG